MSTDLPSSNPFRRKASIPPAHPHPPPQFSPSTTYPHAEPQSISANTKITKKVRVQSPPPSSPSKSDITDDESSTVGEEIDAYSIPSKPPVPIPRTRDPFNSNASDISVSEDEAPSTQPIPAAPRGVPANPFSKTLETMENPSVQQISPIPTNLTSPGRASMDVEAFKRLLMTGIGPTNTQSASQIHVNHALGGDGGSGTDTSSLSRQSIFEASSHSHQESPRTSHEISESDEDHRYTLTAEPTSYIPSTRKKPPPPSSRHGKLIRLELLPSSSSSPNLNTNHNSKLPPTPGSATSNTYFSSSPQSNSEPNRSQTDLNKPLPPPPNRTSHDSDRESVFDKEALGKTPEPRSPSPTLSIRRPPPPPATRRHSQLLSESKLGLSRSNSLQIGKGVGRLSPKVEEQILEYSSRDWKAKPLDRDREPIYQEQQNETPQSNRSRSNSNKSTLIPPHPPPSRRPGSIRNVSSGSHNNIHGLGLTMSSPPLHSPNSNSQTSNPNLGSSPSAISLPAPAPTPPPARGTSIKRNSRPPSVMSVDLSSSREKRMSMGAPPPPPPPKHRFGSSRESGGGNGSGGGRKSMEEESRRGSLDFMARRSVDGNGSGGSRRDGERRDSVASSILEEPKGVVTGGSGVGGPDILAEMSKLQREIDELRVKSESGGGS